MVLYVTATMRPIVCSGSASVGLRGSVHSEAVNDAHQVLSLNGRVRIDNVAQAFCLIVECPVERHLVGHVWQDRLHAAAPTIRPTGLRRQVRDRFQTAILRHNAHSFGATLGCTCLRSE